MRFLDKLICGLGALLVAAHALGQSLPAISPVATTAAGTQTTPSATPVAGSNIGDSVFSGVARPVITSSPTGAPPATTPQQAAPKAGALTVPPERNAFQDFLFRATGQDLPLFGTQFFAAPPSTFASVENAPVSPDYTIGVGDEIAIRAWGQVEINVRQAVDRNGLLNIPSVGTLPVAGVRYDQLQDLIRARIGKVYRNFELSVTMGQLGAMQVFVVGQARQPGSYTIASTSTLVNALFASGGPSAKGSMRRIQVRRGNKTLVEFDLYDMLLKGDTAKDVRLRQGDVIFIPPVGPLVGVAGSVNVPAVYELKDTQAPLGEVMAWAGGLATSAKGRSATIERIDNRQVRRVEEVALDGEGLMRALKDGDFVTFFAVSAKFANDVALRGFVAQPVRLQWREGMRVRDVIPDLESLVSPEYWRRRNQILDVRGAEYQRNLGGLETAPAKPRSDGATAPSAAPTAAEVLTGPSLPLADTEKLDLVRMEKTGVEQQGLITDPRNLRPRIDVRNQEEIAWDYAVIERLLPDLSTTLIPFNLGRAILSADPQHNVLLKPGDVITVFSKADIRVPADRQRRFVRLEGEFVNPGIYQALPGETLRQLVARIGGFTPGAYLFGAEFTRESARVQQQKQLDEAMRRLEEEQLRSVARQARSGEGGVVAATTAQIDAQDRLISRLKSVRANGRIVLDVPAEGAEAKDIPDVVLEDGDRLVVPPVPSLVSVFGSVFGRNSFVHRPERRLGDYLAMAGGATRTADKGSIYLLRADGSVVSNYQNGWLGGISGERIMPGDAIVVPEDFDYVTWRQDVKDWTQILYQFAIGVAGLKVLKDW